MDNIRNDLSGKYILMNDIDLSSIENWDPIGYSSFFTGTLDGNGHVIKNLKSTQGGLFVGGDGATIQNLGLENVDINATTGEVYQVGGLIGGTQNSTITNCYTTGNISGDYNIGGLVGVGDNSTISNCYTTVNVSGDEFVGGLVGYTNCSTITNCYATGNVSGYSNRIGGLVGVGDNSTISNCYTTCSVSGNNSQGLIAGYAKSSDFDNVWADRNDSQLKAFGDRTEHANAGAVSHSEFTSSEFWQDKFDSDVWDLSKTPPQLKKSKAAQGANGNIRLQVGANADADANAIYLDISLDFDDLAVDFSTVDGCLAAVEEVDRALNVINNKIASIGATQNRLNSVLESQTTQIENFTSAKSNIMDADIAEESAEFTKQQILTQSTAALLVQANRLNANTAINLISSL